MVDAMTSASLRAEDLTIRFGGHAAVNMVSCAFKAGELDAKRAIDQGSRVAAAL